MTREEAIEEINKVFEPAFANYIITALTEGVTVSDKALEQEPCEDAVSRQAVLDSFWKLDTELRPSAIDAILNMINNLPSVTPKEKTGHWIDEADEIDAQFERHEYKCSECGRIANYYVGGNECWWDIYKPNFCPNCGARMVSE